MGGRVAPDNFGAGRYEPYGQFWGGSPLTFFSFWGDKNNYLCGCEASASRTDSFCFLRLRINSQRVRGRVAPDNFFLFGVIRIITCAVRTESPLVRAIFSF